MNDVWIGGRLAPLLRSASRAGVGDGRVSSGPPSASIRRTCELVADADDTIVEATLTVRLDPQAGAAMALLRLAEMVAAEYKLRAGMQVHRPGRTATLHLWAEVTSGR